MKTKKLKLDNPCGENWYDMESNEKGAFCNSCAKTVIDFTQLSPHEISEQMKNSKGNICARIKSSQLQIPIPEIQAEQKFNIPYSNVAAGIMIAGSLTMGPELRAMESPVQTEIRPNSEPILLEENKLKIQQSPKSVLDEYVILKGQVLNSYDQQAIENAKISFFSIDQRITCYSNKDGYYSLKIPKELIDNDNVIRISFEDMVHKTINPESFVTKDLIYSKTEINEFHKFQAFGEYFIDGNLRLVEGKETPDPIVFNDGKEIKYKNFQKALNGKRSKFSLKNKETYYFHAEMAEAIYGKAAPGGLILVFDKL